MPRLRLPEVILFYTTGPIPLSDVEKGHFCNEFGSAAYRGTPGLRPGHDWNGKTRPNFFIDWDGFVRLDGYDNAIANTLVQHSSLLPAMHLKYYMPVVNKGDRLVAFIPCMRNRTPWD